MPSYWHQHVHLVSPDPLKAAEFYEKMFGAKRTCVEKVIGGRILVALDLNGSAIRITYPKQPPESAPALTGNRYGIWHFAIGTDRTHAARCGFHPFGELCLAAGREPTGRVGDQTA